MLLFCSCLTPILVHLRHLFLLSITVERTLLTLRWVSRDEKCEIVIHIFISCRTTFFAQSPFSRAGNLLHLDMVQTELHSHMPLQGPKSYIPLEWTCCLLLATAMGSLIENHIFVRWISSPHLKGTLNIFFNSLIMGWSFGNLSYLEIC